MKSRITIEVSYMDGSYGRPYLRVIETTMSDDLKDKVVTEFRRTLEQQSSWCKVDFGHYQPDGTVQWNISPIQPADLPQHIEEMQAIVASRANRPKIQED